VPTRSGKQTEEEENDDMTCEEENDHGFDDEYVEVEVEPPGLEGSECSFVAQIPPPFTSRTFKLQILASDDARRTRG